MKPSINRILVLMAFLLIANSPTASAAGQFSLYDLERNRLVRFQIHAVITGQPVLWIDAMAGASGINSRWLYKNGKPTVWPPRKYRDQPLQFHFKGTDLWLEDQVVGSWKDRTLTLDKQTYRFSCRPIDKNEMHRLKNKERLAVSAENPYQWVMIHRGGKLAAKGITGFLPDGAPPDAKPAAKREIELKRLVLYIAWRDLIEKKNESRIKGGL